MRGRMKGLGLRRLKTCSGRSRLLTAIGNAQRCAHARSPTGVGSYQKLLNSYTIKLGLFGNHFIFTRRDTGTVSLH